MGVSTIWVTRPNVHFIIMGHRTPSNYGSLQKHLPGDRHKKVPAGDFSFVVRAFPPFTHGIDLIGNPPQRGDYCSYNEGDLDLLRYTYAPDDKGNKSQGKS